MLRVNILAGGPKDYWPHDLFEQSGVWIGADHGAYDLIQAGIIPKYAVGDFDSQSKSEQEVMQKHLKLSSIQHVKAEKDETDTELALMKAQGLGADQIFLYGATGGRIDHFLSNLWLITDPKFTDIVVKIQIIDQNNVIQFYQPGRYTIVDRYHKKYLGIMPMTGNVTVRIDGAKYDAANLNTPYPKMWSSNEFATDHFELEVLGGATMVTFSDDAH